MKKILPLLLSAGLVLAGCSKSAQPAAGGAAAAPAAGKKLTVAMLPKAKGKPAR